MNFDSQVEKPEVTRFREYLRCNTMHPNPDYTTAVAFLQKQAQEIGLDFQVIKPGTIEIRITDFNAPKWRDWDFISLLDRFLLIMDSLRRVVNVWNKWNSMWCGTVKTKDAVGSAKVAKPFHSINRWRSPRGHVVDWYRACQVVGVVQLSHGRGACISGALDVSTIWRSQDRWWKDFRERFASMSALLLRLGIELLAMDDEELEIQLNLVILDVKLIVFILSRFLLLPIQI